MQLRLIRFDLLILLLVSLILVEALEKLSRIAALTPNPMAMPFQQMSPSYHANGEKVFELPEVDGIADRKDPDSGKLKKRHDTQGGPGEKAISKTIISGPSHSTALLAEKFAQQALHSKQMQDTIKELTSLDDGHKKHEKISKEAEEIVHPIVTARSPGHAPKTTAKGKGHKNHKGQGKRKHNRHRKPGRKNQHPKHRSKRHYSKKESSKTGRERKSKKPIGSGRRRSLKGKCSSEKSVTCRRKRDDQMSRMGKQIFETSGVNLESLINEDRNSIEDLPNFEPTQRKYKRIPTPRKSERVGDVNHRKRSHMIAQLMLTTTRDPTKKKPGDQGVEYSEYYSDNDNISAADIGDESELDEVPEASIKAQIRSARETADEYLLDEHYDDASNYQLPEEDGERSKRNDQKFVRVMEDPSNSMEYVDNTNGPARASGIVDNEKMSQYLNNYNYIPDQGAQRKGDAYHVPNNPSADVVRMRQPMSNQISPDAHPGFNQNPPVIESLRNKVPSNMIPSVAIAPGQPPLLGNVILSQSPQSRVADENLQYYSIKETPLQHFSISMTSPVAPTVSAAPVKTINRLTNLGGNMPENEEASNLYAATSFVAGSSPSSLSPSPSYDNLEGNNLSLGLATTDKGTSVAPASREVSLATFTMTSSPTDISPASVDFSELFSGLQNIRPRVGPPEVRYFNDNNGAVNGQGPDQIQPIASRETAVEGRAVKEGKKKGPNAKKKDEKATADEQEADEEEQHSAGKATKGEESSPSPTISCKVSVISGSSAPEPGNLTTGSMTAGNMTTGNETKAVANVILNEIIDELEELRLQNPKNEQREGLPCRLTGSWVTTRAGVRVDMNVTNHSVEVSLDHLTPPISSEGLLNVTWNVTGFAPFKRGGPFTLLATNNHTKTLAVFVGACKVCQGVDTIEGSWTVSREPRDCRDFQMSTEIFNEIFRRTRLYAAIKDKQSKHETQSTLVTVSSNSLTPGTTNATHQVTNQLGKLHNQSLELNGME